MPTTVLALVASILVGDRGDEQLVERPAVVEVGQTVTHGQLPLLLAGPGIAPGRKKGAAVHLTAMRRAFEAHGALVVAVDEREGSEVALLALIESFPPIERSKIKGAALPDSRRGFGAKNRRYIRRF